jgi:hypothetical protein
VACGTGPEYRVDIDVNHPWELVALLREMSNVVSEGFTRLLSVSLQVPRVFGPYIRALEVAGEDLLEVLLVVDDIPRQMIQPGPSRVG